MFQEGVLIMGLGKRLKDMTREYMNDPKGQYWKYLNEILNIAKKHNISKKEVSKYVQNWANK